MTILGYFKPSPSISVIGQAELRSELRGSIRPFENENGTLVGINEHSDGSIFVIGNSPAERTEEMLRKAWIEIGDQYKKMVICLKQTWDTGKNLNSLLLHID